MNKKGFTIVELLVVVVVIAILAAITIVAYNGIVAQAETSVLKENLRNISKQIELDKVDRGAYSPTLAGIKDADKFQADGYSYAYESDGLTYCIEAKKISKLAEVWIINSKSGNISPVKGTCGGVAVEDLQSNQIENYTVGNNVVASGDLSKLFLANGYQLGYSFDQGRNWTDLLVDGPYAPIYENDNYNNPDPTYGAYSIAGSGISKNGNHSLIVRDYYQPQQNNCVTRMQPSGNFWAPMSTPNCDATRTNWVMGDVAISNDGSRIAAVSLDEAQLKLSTNGGATWSQINVCGCGGGSIGKMRMTPDGATLAVHHSGQLAVSKDSGATWTRSAVPQSRNNWSESTFGLSSDGSTIVYSSPDQPSGTARPDGVYVSRDTGETWTERMNNPKLFWSSLNVSANGKSMVGIAATSASYSSTDRNIYASNNYGETWKKLDELGTDRWLYTFISEDGTKAMALKIVNGTANIYRWSMQ